jgi:RimJ/RimL family protein N-acetyltransferase
MSDLTIRECRGEEVEAVLELWRQSAATPSLTDNAGALRRAIAESCSHVLVAEIDGQIIGSIIGTFDGWRGNIYRLAVHPTFRRRAIARALLGAIRDRLSCQGAERITALVEKSHHLATSFWAAVGYRVDERIARYVHNVERGDVTQARSEASGEAPKITVDAHISLSAFRRGDEPALVELLNDKDIYDRTLRIPYPYTEASAGEWLEIAARMTRELGQATHWAIRDEHDRLMGGVGFSEFRPGQSHRAEIGYWLGRPYWGRGIMTTVVRKACAYAFDQWGLAKIIAHVFVHNGASARVLEKCGFEQEGLLRKHHCKDGKQVDARLFGLLKLER